MNDGQPTPFFNMTQAEVFDEYIHVINMRASTMMDAKDPSAIVAVEVQFSDKSTTTISQSTPGDACDFASGLIQSAHESRFYAALYMVMRDSMRRSDGEQKTTTESVMIPFNHMVSAIRDHLPHVDHALRQPSTDTPDGPITSNAPDILLACARCSEPVSVHLMELPDAVRTAYQDDPRMVNVLCPACTAKANLPWQAGKGTIGVRTTVDTPDLSAMFEPRDQDDQDDQVTP